MNKAAIDIGSNTVQFLLINEREEILVREQFVTSLGRDLDKNKAFHENSMLDTRKALDECSKYCAKYTLKPENVKVTATEASRVALNAKDFFNSILDSLGFKVEVISSDKEAYYSSKGFLFNNKLTEKFYSLVDIGGASTELINIEVSPFQVLKTISLPIGSVRMKNWDTEGILDGQLEKVFKSFDFAEFKTRRIIGLAGTSTSLAAIDLKLERFIPKAVDQLVLSTEKMHKLKEVTSRLSVDELLEHYPFLGKRAQVIKYGARLFIELQKLLGFEEVEVTTRTLVHGSILS